MPRGAARRTSRVGEVVPVAAVHAARAVPAPREVPAHVLRGANLKGSIGEGSNHSNFSHQSSVKILSKLSTCC